MANLQPKYISFDCYGTLINCPFGELAASLFADEIPADQTGSFSANWAQYRLDQAMGEWQPYRDLIASSLRRTCQKWAIAYDDTKAQAVYDSVTSWQPHPDVIAGLTKIAEQIPLVILSNAMESLIPATIRHLQVPFHRVYTAEAAGAYKPHMRPFEYMLDELGCQPEDVMHCSSSFRYDHNTASDLGFGARVFINRGHEPSNPFYRDVEIPHLGCLPAVVGL
jgi:2-haloacid dehalogenase